MPNLFVFCFASIILLGSVNGLSIQDKKTLCHELSHGRDPLYNLAKEIKEITGCGQPDADSHCIMYYSMLRSPATYGRSRMLRALNCWKTVEMPDNLLTKCGELEDTAKRIIINIKALFVREGIARALLTKYANLYKDYMHNFTSAIGCAERTATVLVLSGTRQTAICQQFHEKLESTKMKSLATLVRPQCVELLGDKDCQEYLMLLQEEASKALDEAADIIQCNKDYAVEQSPEAVCRSLRAVPGRIPQFLMPIFQGPLKSLLNHYTFLFSLFIESAAVDVGCSSSKQRQE